MTLATHSLCLVQSLVWVLSYSHRGGPRHCRKPSFHDLVMMILVPPQLLLGNPPKSFPQVLVAFRVVAHSWTDIGCKHGIDIDGNGKKVKCKYCSKIMSGGVFRFKRHLAGTREDSEPCAIVSDEIKLLMMNIVAESKATKEKKRRLNSIDEDEESGEGAEATNLQGQRGFGSKGKKVQKTDDSLQEFRDDWKRTGCSIMSDGWTDKKRRSICNFLVNSPKGTIFLYSLDTSDISKTTDKFFKMLDDVVKFVGEENVVQVITDNAANFKAAGELLMHTRPHSYWTPCAAHCIDLILEDLEKHLKVHEVTIKKGRKITTYIYGRTMLISMLKKYSNGRDLVRPGMTRFAIAYLTLACLHEMKASLMRLFSFEEWKKSKFGTSQEGRKVEDSVLDSRFWKNVSICLKAAALLMVVLRLVDFDQQPAMGFIYVEMDRAKEMIKSNFNNVKKNSSGCERNWSSFEMVHTKRRNCLHQNKMNDLVYVMYNLKLKSRQTRKTVAIPFEDMESDDEWITEEGDDIFDEDNLQVEQEQPLGESGSGRNIDMVVGSLTNPTLDAFDIDNLVLNDNVEDHFSTEEELGDDRDEDNGGGGDIGDDFIRGLMDI
ncbi:hypothetical protein HKD37_09G024839 [Glycine soja]